MRTELGMCEQRRPIADVSRSKDSALIPQHSALGSGGAMRKIFWFLPVIAVVGGAAAGHAQHSKNVPRIGVLISSSPSRAAQRIQAFERGLHELGHVEGKNIVLEYRYADGKREPVP